MVVPSEIIYFTRTILDLLKLLRGELGRIDFASLNSSPKITGRHLHLLRIGSIPEVRVRQPRVKSRCIVKYRESTFVERNPGYRVSLPCKAHILSVGGRNGSRRYVLRPVPSFKLGSNFSRI